MNFSTRFLALAALCCAAAVGCGDGGKPGRPKVAYVTNGIADFWLIGQKGAEDAAAKYDVELDVRMPPKGVADQKKMVQDLLAKNVQGIAISPIDPANQGDLLDEIVAAGAILVTQDSDAPNSKRKVYIGVDNYVAGRLCGKLVKQAIPDGGGVAIFVGRLGQDNAKLRRQGVIDELLDRTPDSTRYDEPGKEVKGDKYTILDTRTDDFDFAKAKSNVQTAISNLKELKCLVGLFAYNPPIMVEAVKEAEAGGQLKPGALKIVGFDEDHGTLAGIEAGDVHGTVVQNPYQYGFQSVKVLAALVKGDQSVIPANGVIPVDARQITKENLKEYWDGLKQQLGEKKPEPAKAS